MSDLTYNQWKEDLKAVPSAEQPAWIHRTLKNKKNLHIYGRYFFPHIIKGTDEVPDSHRDLIAELNNPEDSAIIFPRGFAKTTWEKIDTLHDICYKLEPIILYISVTLRDAQFHFESIKSELENNVMLRAVYGNLVPPETDKGRKWTNTHFETNNKINVVARGACKGRGVNIKNQRPTKIIGDDLEDDERVRNPEQREKLKRWINEVILPSKDKKRGQFKFIGTVLHKNAVILSFYQSHGGIFRQAIENNQSIWPNYWTLEDLDKVKNGYTKEDGTFVEGIGTRAFMQEYMNEPTDNELANMPFEWIDNNYYTEIPKFHQPNKVITIDPQAGESALADEYAITCVAAERNDRHKYVLEQEAGRKSQMDQAIAVVRMWQRHPETRVVGVEKVLNQTAVFQILMDWRSGKIDFEEVDNNNRNIPVKAIDPKGKDKVARLQVHEPEIERGEIHLRPEMKILREQLLFMGTKAVDHDDRADSLIQALDLLPNNLQLKGDKEYNRDNTGDKTIAGNLFKMKF